MPPLPPAAGMTTWRTHRATILVGGALVGFAATSWVVQARSTAQIRQAQAEAARERDQLEKRFDSLRAVLDRLSKSVASDGHAVMAATSGREAIEQGRWGAGQLFLINAITNDPKNIEHLKTYTNVTLGHERPPEEALEQLASILQMAACHVAPDDVSTVIGLIDRVAKVRDRPRPGESSATQAEAATPRDGLDEEWSRLKATDLAISQTPTRLTEHLRALENFASTLDEQGSASEERTREVADQILRWTEIAQASKNAHYIDQCLAKLTDLEINQMGTDRAVSIVQAAEAVLPSFWGIRPGVLPEELQKRINGYSATITDRVNKIAANKSDVLFHKIDEVLKTAKPIETVVKDFTKLGPLQRQCLVLEEQIKEAQVLAAQLPSSDKILAAQEKLKGRTEELQKLRNQQYSRYQTEVIQRCQKVFDIYNSYRIGISESNGIIAFRNEKLAQVDQALLTPEVSRMFNDVFGKLMGKFGAENLVMIETEMGSTAKLKLEEF